MPSFSLPWCQLFLFAVTQTWHPVTAAPSCPAFFPRQRETEAGDCRWNLKRMSAFVFLKNRIYPGGFKRNHNMCLVGRISLLTGFDTMDFWKGWQACERSFSIQICKVLDGFRRARLKYYPVDFKQTGWKEKRFEWVTVWEKKTRGLRREKTQMKWRSVWHIWVSAVASFSTPWFPLLFRADFWAISFLSPAHTTSTKSKNHPNQMTL